jgi:N6-adenosine-specific RNA methylase IME4/ParB-like chromosome segregation protein Spo0J
MIKYHVLADIFPLMEGQAFDELADDIKAHGPAEKIVLHDGQILDGRNRYRALMRNGLTDEEILRCHTEPFVGADPLAFVISKNLKRRHLNESQRGMVHARIATLRKGANQHTAIAVPSQADAAKLLNVSVDTGQRARRVLESGAPELVAAVDRGDVAVSTAAEVATRPVERQRELMASYDKREILAAARQIRAERAEIRRAERVANIVEISKGNTGLPTDRRFAVLYADPPWRYEHLISVSREIEEQYPTMATEDICALLVADICTPDAMLFLWVPSPLLYHGMRVIEAWGFEYRTHMVWVKDKIGPGYYVRQQHEVLLIARRGNPPVPPENARPPSVFHAPRSATHSKKPVEGYELIERMYPELPKIELFARAAREGWHRWGNQALTVALADSEDDEPAFDDDAFDAWREARAAAGVPEPIEIPPPSLNSPA